MPLSDTVIVALIIGVPSTITALGTLIVALRTSKKVDEVKRNTDGLMTQRVQAEGDKQLEIGKAAGVESERVRTEGGG